MISKEIATETVSILAAEFNVPLPRIKWHGNTTNGMFRILEGLILGPKMWRGIDCVLHEFAHYLHYKRIGLSLYLKHYGHGTHFYCILTEVAAAWYGHAEMYTWDTEYEHMRSGPRKEIIK